MAESQHSQGHAIYAARRWLILQQFLAIIVVLVILYVVEKKGSGRPSGLEEGAGGGRSYLPSLLSPTDTQPTGHGPQRRRKEGSSSSWPSLDTYSLLYTEAGHAREGVAQLPQPPGYAHLTAQAQALLLAHQFPLTCAGKRFLVSHGNDPRTSGVGSHMHTAGSHLGIALEQGRIFVWGGDVMDKYTDDQGTCPPGVRNVLCFFQPPSNCTAADLDGAADVSYVFHGMELQKQGLPWHHVPTPMLQLWQAEQGQAGAQGIHELKYWWRAQSVAFLMRVHAKALSLLREYRAAPGAVLSHANATQSSPRSSASPAVPLDWAQRQASAIPFAPGTVSIHVRHGDKSSEMQLVDTKVYLQAAEGLVVASNPLLLLIRHAFVSTEDPAVLDELHGAGGPAHPSGSGSGSGPGLGPGRGWVYSYYDLPRINSNGLDQVAKVPMPAGRLTLLWFLQLLMALEADAWVGTRGSNWNRLIDELRCIWVPKCAHSFVEVGKDDAHKDYNW